MSWRAPTCPYTAAWPERRGPRRPASSAAQQAHSAPSTWCPCERAKLSRSVNGSGSSAGPRTPARQRPSRSCSTRCTSAATPGGCRRTRISRRTPKPGSRPRGCIRRRCCRSRRPARRSGGRPGPCSAPGPGSPGWTAAPEAFRPAVRRALPGVRVRDPPARGAHARASAGSPSASCSNNTATRPAAVVVPWPVRVTTWAWPSPATVIDPRTTPFATGANRTGTVVEPPGGMGGGSPAKAG